MQQSPFGLVDRFACQTPAIPFLLTIDGNPWRPGVGLFVSLLLRPRSVCTIDQHSGDNGATPRPSARRRPRARGDDVNDGLARRPSPRGITLVSVLSTVSLETIRGNGGVYGTRVAWLRHATRAQTRHLGIVGAVLETHERRRRRDRCRSHHRRRFLVVRS